MLLHTKPLHFYKHLVEHPLSFCLLLLKKRILTEAEELLRTLAGRGRASSLLLLTLSIQLLSSKLTLCPGGLRGSADLNQDDTGCDCSVRVPERR